MNDINKQKLLDELSKESLMVLSLAYSYAKYYVNYGVDVTKAWTTAVEQVAIIEKVKQTAWKEVYDSFKSKDEIVDDKHYNCSIVVKQVDAGRIYTETFKFDDYRVATAVCNILDNLDKAHFNYHEERIEDNESKN